MTDSPPARSESELLLDTGKVWEELHLIKEVDKKGAKLQRLIKEIHVARVEYDDAILNYRRHASSNTELARIMTDDIAQDKTEKSEKRAKTHHRTLPICGPTGPAEPKNSKG